MPEEITISTGAEAPAEQVAETAAETVAAVSEAVNVAAQTQVANAMALNAIEKADDETPGLLRRLLERFDALESKVDSLAFQEQANTAQVIATVETEAEEVEEEIEEEIAATEGIETVVVETPAEPPPEESGEPAPLAQERPRRKRGFFN